MRIRIFLWGTGKVAEKTMRYCTSLDAYEILGFIDNNPEKIGTKYYNKTVFSPSVLMEVKPDKIIVLTDDFYEEVKQQIVEKYNFSETMIEPSYFFYKESLFKRYAGTSDIELYKVLQYIEKNGLDMFNYEFVKKYDEMNIEVYFDQEYQMFYVIHYGKRMYFPKHFIDKKMVKEYYKCILIEQDKESPHRYTDETFCVNEGDVVIDAGVAEGNFSLENVDKASKIYLIEADKRWAEALKVTFRNYTDKVTIINAFVSSYDEGLHFKLDSLIPENKVNFIKMDIEGNEWDGLQGAERIVENSEKLKLAICSYHSDFDQTLIEAWMDKQKIQHSTTRGYMWYPVLVRQNYISTRLNNVIVRGNRNEDCTIT